MTMNQGLFDIQVGSTAAPTTTTASSTPAPPPGPDAPATRIYMVAVPKNQALTMLLERHDRASMPTSATELNGEIILTSGWTIDDSTDAAVLYGQSGANGSIAIGGAQGAATFTSDVKALPTTSVDVTASSGDVAFAGDVLLDSFLSPGLGSVTVTANNNRHGLGRRRPRSVRHQFGQRRGGRSAIDAGGGGDVGVTGEHHLVR